MWRIVLTNAAQFKEIRHKLNQIVGEHQLLQMKCDTFGQIDKSTHKAQ